MDKISHIKLKEHKALTECKLENLGKVNIICGKNSSGKTTLLEAFLLPDKRLIGKNLSLGNPVELATWQDALSPAINITANNTTYHYGRIVRQTGFGNVIEKTLSDLKIAYSDEILKFAKIFHQSTINVINKNVPYGATSTIANDMQTEDVKPAFFDTISKLFDRVYKLNFTQEIEQKEIAYLAPKRNISAVTKVNDGTITDQGNGLLQRIYNIKNALPGTDLYFFYETLYQKFIEVSTEYKFNIASEDGSSDWRLFFSKQDRNDWRPAENWGLGLQDLLAILYFALVPNTSIVLIEEPENHLHPELQRRLLQFLKEETPDNKQFIITTHSNIFLDNTYADRIFHTSIIEDKLQIDDATSKAQVMNDLGYSPVDNLVSDLIIIVEGISDKKVLIEFLRKMGLYGKFNIKFWLLIGDFMRHVELDGFVENYHLMVLLDNDPKSIDNRTPFIKHCRSLNIPITTLKRYSIESYFPIEIYKESFPDKISDKITEIDPNKPVWDQLGSIKKSDIKKGSEKFARKTSWANIETTDLGKFLIKIRGKLEENN